MVVLIVAIGRSLLVAAAIRPVRAYWPGAMDE